MQVANRHQHQAMRLLQRCPGFVLLAQGGQCATVPPPDVLALAEAGAREAALALQLDAALRGAMRGGGIAALQQRLGQRDLHIQLEARVVLAHQAQEVAQALQGADGVAFGGLQFGGQQLAVVAGNRLVERADQGVEGAPARARAGQVAQVDLPLQHRAHL
jgi:hypothetical protein